ncbi:MAG: hypothetical protein ABIP45_11650, partial [Knoellia sp.]
MTSAGVVTRVAAVAAALSMITAVSITPANAVERVHGDHLTAASTAPTQTGKSITSADIGAVKGAAADQWPGWDVSGASIVIGDLPGNTLAVASGNTISVDADAAGWGWSVSGSPDSGTMDLFTALAHEYGHVAGFEHGSGLMASTLGAGERRYNSADRKYPPKPEPVVAPAPEPVAVPAPEAKSAAAPDPAPADPAPADPAPTDPAPADPAPADPAPTDPAPANPGPGDPAPAEAGSIDPVPASAAPAAPAPSVTTTGQDEDSTLAPTTAATATAQNTSTAPAPAESTPAVVDPAVWTLQMAGTTARLIFNADGTVTFGGQTRSVAGLSTIVVTGTSGDDAFTVDRGSSNPAIRVVFDGAAGYDTLATAGAASSATSLAADQHSGVLYLDATVIEYLNIEPIVNSGDTADAIFDLGSSDNGDAELQLVAGQLTLSGAGFETVSFSAPSSSLTIRGGGGIDQLTVMGAIALGIANLIIQMERIILADNAAITTSGSVSLEAGATANGGPTLGCVVALATHCADAAVDVNGGDISALSVNLSATSTVTPDATHATAYGIVVDSQARVSITGNAKINATGIVGLSATSTVGPVALVKDYGDVAVITSQATVTLGDTAVVIGGADVTMTSTSTVTAGATPGSAGKTEGDAGSPGGSNFDAAVAIITVTATTITKVTDTARLAVTGNLDLTATNTATLTALGDATGATSGAGIAVVNLNQITESSIDSTSPTATTTGGKLTLRADSEATLSATSKASPGGSTQNDKAPNDSSRGKDQAKTAEGNIGVVGALSVNVVNGATRAHISGAKVNAGQSQTVHAASKNTATATADGSATSSGAVGVGVAVALNLISLVTEAFLDGGATLGSTGVVVEALGPVADKNAFTATATSGAAGSSNVSAAGSLALNLITSRTLATVRGLGAILGGADLSTTARANNENTAKAGAKQDGTGAVGIGVSVALGIINTTVRAGLDVGNVLLGAKKLIINATTTDATTTEAEGGAAGGTSVSALGVVAITISNVATSASILAGNALTTLGDIMGTATQTATAETSAKGSTTAGSGASLAAALSFGLTSANHVVDSSLYRNVTTSGSITMAADGTSTTSTTATATSAGAKGGASTGGKDTTNKDTKEKGDEQLGFASDKSSTASGTGAKDASTPAAKNEDGATVSVAAAIALNLVTSTTTAIIAPAIVVIATGPVSFKTRNNTDAKAVADGSASNGSSVTIGAALAVNKVILRNEASVGIGAALTAGGLVLAAQMRPIGAGGADTTYEFLADAKAGASGSSGNLGIAGAFAINIVDATTVATLNADGNNPAPLPPASPLPGVVIINAGAVSFTAGSSSSSTSKGKASQSGSGTVGIGAGLGLNLVTDIVRAGVDQVLTPTRGPPLTGAGSLTIAATNTHSITTSAESGSAGGSVSITPAVAITLATVTTTASFGASASGLSATGAISATASQTVKATTTAKGDTTVGSSAGIGVSLALAVIDARVDSGTARSIAAGGAVSFVATGTADVSTVADAAAQGASKSEGKDGGGKDVNKKADDNLGSAKTTQNDETGKTTGTSSTPKAASDEGGGASVSIAGAVAINVVTSTVRGWLGTGVTISSGGVVTVRAWGDTDVSADAKGDSASDASVGIGAGVAVNKVDIVTSALTGTATITATGLILTAGMAGGDSNDVIRRWTGGADGKWELVTEGKELPGPSKDDLAYVKT